MAERRWVEKRRRIIETRALRDPDAGHAKTDTPRVLPLSYPGRSAGKSVLVRPVNSLDLTLRPHRRLGQARVRLDERGLPGDERSAHTDVPLNYALLRLNEPPVGVRYPVLAIGASPSPAYLRDLLDQPGRSLAVPLIRARLDGMAVGFAACVTQWGYIPVTPIFGAELSDEQYVMWLDERQVALVDEPESGFQRILVSPDDGVRITLAGSGEVLGACHVLTSRYGSLANPETGLPIMATGDIGQQSMIMATMLRSSAPLRAQWGRTPQGFVEGARDDPLEVTANLFADAGWVRHQPEFDRLVRPKPPDDRYDGLLPAETFVPGAHRVTASPGQADRDGQSVVRVTAAAAARLELEDAVHVVVRSAVPGAADGMDALALVAVDESANGDDGSVETDQVIRNAIGVEVGEEVTLHPVTVFRRRWPDMFIGRPNYVTARVQVADLTTVEREVCLLDPLTLELLGVESGDEVVLEGNAGVDGVVAQTRIQAFATSTEIQQRRIDLDGGDFGVLFPAARDALGVYPDLPWAFLDRGTREVLGLRCKLAPVRIKSSRSFQLRSEIRDTMLLFGIAFIGVLQIIDHQLWQVVVLGVLVAMITGAIAIRMRGRLSRRAAKLERPWLASTLGPQGRRRPRRVHR